MSNNIEVRIGMAKQRTPMIGPELRSIAAPVASRPIIELRPIKPAIAAASLTDRPLAVSIGTKCTAIAASVAIIVKQTKASERK